MGKEARKLRRCFKEYTEKGFAIEIAHHIQSNTQQLKVKIVKYMCCVLIKDTKVGFFCLLFLAKLWFIAWTKWLMDSCKMLFDKLAYEIIIWLFDWSMTWLTDWLNHWLFPWLIDYLIDRSNDRFIDWLVVCLFDWLIDWFNASLAHWPMDSFAYWPIDLSTHRPIGTLVHGIIDPSAQWFCPRQCILTYRPQ